MSFILPGDPRQYPQIQSSPSAIASSTSVGSFYFPVYCPAHATGQFFKCQCLQSQQQMHPEKHLDAFIASIRRMSSSFGRLRYSFSDSWQTVLTKPSYDSFANDSHIWHNSVIWSIHMPYASIRKAAMTRSLVWIPSIFAASRRWTNILFPIRAQHMRSNAAHGI